MHAFVRAYEPNEHTSKCQQNIRAHNLNVSMFIYIYRCMIDDGTNNNIRKNYQK